MEEFPANSQVLKQPAKEPAETDGKKADRPQKIVLGKVVQRKKPLGKRLMETFFGAENSVWSYILNDILIPAAKDTVADKIGRASCRERV